VTRKRRPGKFVREWTITEAPASSKSTVVSISEPPPEVDEGEPTLQKQQDWGEAPELTLFEPTLQKQQDWGEAPELTLFEGRNEELSELEQWIVNDHCKLVSIYGIGGIGKTTLSVKLAEQVVKHFDYLIWRSLNNRPPVGDILADCIKFFSDQKKKVPEGLKDQISSGLSKTLK